MSLPNLTDEDLSAILAASISLPRSGHSGVVVAEERRGPSSLAAVACSGRACSEGACSEGACSERACSAGAYYEAQGWRSLAARGRASRGVHPSAPRTSPKASGSINNHF